MRLGELLALRWEDVDLVAGAVMVRRSFARVRNLGNVVQEPKTASSRRRITLDATTLAIIKGQRKH